MKKVLNILDISKWNAIVNFSTISQSVDGVIVRAGFSGNMNGVPSIDPRFFPYITELSNNKISVGSYYVSAAITEEEAKAEAQFFVSLIHQSNVRLSLPIYVCSEWTSSTHKGRSDSLTVDERSKIIKTFVEECGTLGLKCGIMATSSWFKSHLDVSVINNTFFWVIKDDDSKIDNVVMTRVSDKHEVKGIAGHVSLNETSEIINPYLKDDFVEEKPKKERIKKKKTYKEGGFFNVKDAEVYKTSIASTPLKTISGRVYITNARILNNRIRVTDVKGGETIGWVII